MPTFKLVFTEDSDSGIRGWVSSEFPDFTPACTTELVAHDNLEHNPELGSNGFVNEFCALGVMYLLRASNDYGIYENYGEDLSSVIDAMMRDYIQNHNDFDENYDELLAANHILSLLDDLDHTIEVEDDVTSMVDKWFNDPATKKWYPVMGIDSGSEIAKRIAIALQIGIEDAHKRFSTTNKNNVFYNFVDGFDTELDALLEKHRIGIDDIFDGFSVDFVVSENYYDFKIIPTGYAIAFLAEWLSDEDEDED